MGLFGFSKPADILIVDDDLVTRMMLRDALEVEGYRVDDAEDGENAIEKCQKSSYSLILLDMKMPGKNGIETLSEIRRLESHRKTPVFMLTGESKIGTVQEAYDLQVNDYILKPPDLPTLLGKIQQFVAAKKD